MDHRQIPHIVQRHYHLYQYVQIRKLFHELLYVDECIVEESPSDYLQHYKSLVYQKRHELDHDHHQSPCPYQSLRLHPVHHQRPFLYQCHGRHLRHRQSLDHYQHRRFRQIHLMYFHYPYLGHLPHQEYPSL